MSTPNLFPVITNNVNLLNINAFNPYIIINKDKGYSREEEEEAPKKEDISIV